MVTRRFGLGISTCHKLVLEVCTAIKTVLMPKFVQWPDVGGSMYTFQELLIKKEFSLMFASDGLVRCPMIKFWRSQPFTKEPPGGF